MTTCGPITYSISLNGLDISNYASSITFDSVMNQILVSTILVSDVGTYTVAVTGTDLFKTATMTFTLDIIEPVCIVDTIGILQNYNFRYTIGASGTIQLPIIEFQLIPDC